VDALEVMALLRALSVETERLVGRLAHRHQLHRTDLNALAVIIDATRRGEPVTAGDLGARLNLSSPATSALLDRLVRAGHVNRVRSTRDRRKVELRMTAAATEVGRSTLEPLAGRVGSVLEDLDPVQQELVVGFLTDVLAAMVDVPDGVGHPGSAPPPGASTSAL
jgi:DNA-binding MarR family transcriptional regulator